MRKEESGSFEEAGEIQKKKARRHPLQALFLLDVMKDHDSRPVFLWAVGALLLGTLAYHWLEGWSLLDSLYFSVVTLATVGYGDLTPTTPISRLFTIAYVINGITILLALFDRMRIVRTRRLQSLAESGEEPQAQGTEDSGYS